MIASGVSGAAEAAGGSGAGAVEAAGGGAAGGSGAGAAEAVGGGAAGGLELVLRGLELIVLHHRWRDLLWRNRIL